MVRIEFCGGLGVGKSTLARALALRWSLPLLSETYENIPYWHHYHADPSSCALEKDLSFLLSYGNELLSAKWSACVCDFALFQAVAYSTVAGNEADTATVKTVLRRMTASQGHPVLVVRLRCLRDVQLRRIRDRARTQEQGITAEFLEALETAIDREVDALPAHIARVDLDTSFLSAPALLEDSRLRAAVEKWLKGAAAKL
jgi:deoxyguanosine kinase